MLPLRLGSLSLLGGGGGGGCEFQHESAFPGIFQRRLDHIRHKALDPIGQVFLQVEVFLHRFSFPTDPQMGCKASPLGLCACKTAVCPLCQQTEALLSPADPFAIG